MQIFVYSAHAGWVTCVTSRAFEDLKDVHTYDTCVYAFSRPVLEAYAPGEFFLDMRLSFLEVYIHSAPCALQFYGTNEEAKPVFFGDASSKKFGTYFVKDGKVRRRIA